MPIAQISTDTISVREHLIQLFALPSVIRGKPKPAVLCFRPRSADVQYNVVAVVSPVSHQDSSRLLGILSVGLRIHCRHCISFYPKHSISLIYRLSNQDLELTDKLTNVQQSAPDHHKNLQQPRPKGSLDSHSHYPERE